MNCPTCDIEYKDDIPHPPSACAEHAGAEMKKAKKALDSALEHISKITEENKRMRTGLEHVFRCENVEGHRSFSIEGCPICEARNQLVQKAD